LERSGSYPQRPRLFTALIPVVIWAALPQPGTVAGFVLAKAWIKIESWWYTCLLRLCGALAKQGRKTDSSAQLWRSDANHCARSKVELISDIQPGDACPGLRGAILLPTQSNPPC